MACSAVMLSFATVAAAISAGLLAIAFSTDNWVFYSVERTGLKELGVSGNTEVRENIDINDIYYTRTRGLFRICFPDAKPERGDIYMSPVETNCRNIDYYIPDEDNETKGFTDDRMAVIHMGRAMIALFIVSFFFIFVAFWTGVAGCWRRSPGNITSTAILMVLACLFSAGAMGLWHGVEYYEYQKLMEPDYFRKWPEAVKDATTFQYDWSYFIAWIGVGTALLSSMLFSGAAAFMRRDKYMDESGNVQYLMPGMPVYPQKYPYPPYGGYQGPYYGSQYGSQYGYNGYYQ